MEPRLCSSCHKPLAPDVPMGLCPECLIKAGFPTGDGTDTDAATKSSFIPPAIEEIAKLFPQLEILELIGKGGMGAVYKARQKQLNRFVALKILPPGIGSDPAFAERFTREARALAQLNHPNIVTLYEFGESSGQFYFLMEFVDGVNLRQLLQTSRVSPREALAIVPQICDALQFAHDQGIVHRDIKPENILLDRRGRVKVADFGLAKLMGTGDEPAAGDHAAGSTSLTDAGKVMGTPNYMSPEQKENPGDVDHRADIYALGVVFYQMLTGELPGQRIESPSKKVHIDVRLDEIVLRALEKKPELRYQQASVLKNELETIAADSAKVESETQKLEVKPRFSRNAIAGVICLLLSAFAMPFFFKLTREMPGDLERLDHLWVVARWSVALVLVATPLFIGSLLGWIAIAQIRRSPGKLRGFRLAVFDALFFPLLALTVAFLLIFNKEKAIIRYLGLSDGLAENVWHPARLSDSIGEQYGEAQIRVTSVEQEGQTVLIKFLCDTSFPDHDFLAQYSGPIFDYPSNIVAKVANAAPNLDCLMAPAFMNGGNQNVLFGSKDLKGKSAGQIGFVLPDETTAAEAAKQVREVHLNKPRGLKQPQGALMLFSLFRNVGTDVNGKVITENLSAMLCWPPPEAKIRNEDNAQQLTQEGWQLWQNHKLNEAAWKFGQAVKLDPKDGNAWNGLGWATFNSGKLNQAQHSFDRAIALDPNQPGALNGLGQIYLAQHKFGEAEGYLLRAAPNAPAAWFGLARIYLLEGRFDQAEIYAQKIVDSGQGDEVANKMLAAAKAKKLDKDLQRMIEPSWAQTENQPQASTDYQDWLKIQSLSGWIADAEGSDAKLQSMARKALADLGANIFPPMFAFLNDPTNETSDAGDRRFNMARSVEFIGASASAGVPKFAAMLKSGQQLIAYSGAVGLAYSSPAVPEAMSILTNALTDPAPGIRDAGIYGIQLSLTLETNDPAQAALPLIVKNTTDPLDYIRSDAAVALMSFTQHQCQRNRPVPDFIIPPLIKLLSDKYYHARFYALTAFANSCLTEKIKPYLPAVLAMTNDPSEEVRRVVASMLNIIHSTAMQAQQSTLEQQPPVVVETFPVSGARDVPPGETEIHVRFSKEMQDGFWSFVNASNDSPEQVSKPRFEADGKTCVLKVKLQADHTYAYWLNSDEFHNFKDRSGNAAVPYLLVFHTSLATEPLTKYIGSFITNFKTMRLTNGSQTFDLNIQPTVVSANCFNAVQHTSAALGPDWHPSGNWFVYVEDARPTDISGALHLWAYDGGTGLWQINVSQDSAGWISRDRLKDKPPAVVMDRLPDNVKKALP